jgi:NAD(P) transhydrogenase subunit alpha
MKFATPREAFDGEARVAMTPESVLQFLKLGHECFFEGDAGRLAGISDDAYRAAGVRWSRAGIRFTPPAT